MQSRWKACRPSQGNTRISSSGSKTSTQIGQVVGESSEVDASGGTTGTAEEVVGEEGEGGEGRIRSVIVGGASVDPSFVPSLVSAPSPAPAPAHLFRSSSPTLRTAAPNSILSSSNSFLLSKSSFLILSSVPRPNLTTGNVSRIALVSPLVRDCPPSLRSSSSSDESPL